MNNNKTKIVVTIGPNVETVSKLKGLRKSGMSIVRLNGSHNTLAWHKEVIKRVKSNFSEIPILFDIPGKKIRTAQLEYEPTFRKGEQIVFTTNIKYLGKDKVPINNKRLHLLLQTNDIIYADDGTLSFKVKKIIKNEIYCASLSDGKLKSSKGINVPHINLGADNLSLKEKKFIKFAIKYGVNFIGVSFVESASYIKKIRNIIKNNNLKIIAKIENQGGLDNMESIIEEADAIMIDRGDLSIETKTESIAIYQKKIIDTCKRLSKPVIVATEMLNSMIENPFPTKAEVTDISNAILDGASAIMLSGETAVGSYPFISVQAMKRISQTVELNQPINYDKKLDGIPAAIGSSIASISNRLKITKIIVITSSGYAARIISSLMLRQPIIAVSNIYENSVCFNLYRGTQGVHLNVNFLRNNLQHIPICLKQLWSKKIINNKDMILVTGVGYPNTGNRMNMIQTHYVSDLKKTFNW